MSREQGPPKGGRGAPARAGDLTPQAAIDGRRPNAADLRSHPHLADGAPAPRRRPPRLTGMRPAVARRRGGDVVPVEATSEAAT